MKDLVAVLQHKNMYGILQYAVQAYGDLPAITNCGENQPDHSYRELLQQVQQLAAELQAHSGKIIPQKECTNKDKVGKVQYHYVLCARNSYNWIVSFFAIICSGDVVIPLDADITDSELAEALSSVDADILITDRKFDCISIKQCTLQKFIQSGSEIHLKYEYRPTTDENKPSVFLMTSGVTSAPKYVMLSQRNLIYSTLNGLDAVPLESGKRVLSVLPPHHSYEISCGLLYHICLGSHIYVNDKKINFINNLKKVKPQCIAAVPSIVYALIALMKGEQAARKKSCVETIEIIYCGGAAVDSSAIGLLKSNGVMVLQGYGMTECAPAITFNRIDDFTVNTVGKPLRFVQIQIKGKELYVKAPNVMIGYYKNPIATAEILQNDWLQTGDVGYFDSEGHLILCGRVKNIIVLNTGENVYPEELEERIFQKDQRIKYCKVYEDKGSVSVQIFSDVHSKEDINRIISDVNNEVSSFKRIQKIYILEAMPKVTALGKPYRR